MIKNHEAGLKKSGLPLSYIVMLNSKINMAMTKLDECISLMKKLCDINITIEDLKELQADIEDKKQLVDCIEKSKESIELERIKEIMDKVDNGETIFQGKASE